MSEIRGRIFIVPIGHLAQRAKEHPLSSNQEFKIIPNHTYLITQHHDKPNGFVDRFRTVVEDVHTYFAKQGFVTVFGAENYFNLFELMSIFRYICEQHQTEDIFINVGSGSKLTAMAGFITSGFFDNVRCFYPKLEIMRPEIPGSQKVADLVDNVQMLQSFPVQEIDADLIPVLNYLKDNSSPKRDILDYLISEGMILEFFRTKDGKRKERSPQSMYNILKRNYIDLLLTQNLILENDAGELELTDHGEDMQLIFGKEDFHYEQI